MMRREKEFTGIECLKTQCTHSKCMMLYTVCLLVDLISDDVYISTGKGSP